MSTNNKINSWSTLFQNFKDKAKTGATGAVDKMQPVAQSVPLGNASVGTSDTSLLGQAKSLNEKYGGNILSYDTSNMTTDALRGYNSDLFKYQNIMAYNAATDAAKKSATEAESYANTRRMLMQKYIPDTMKAMGLSGTGASANALLQMDNAYNGYALNAKSQAAQAEQNALQEYQNALATYTQNANEEKLLQKQTESKDVRNAYEAQITSRVDGLIANGEKLTQTEYDAILTKIKENTSLTDEDKKALYAQLESYAMGNYGVYSAEEESKAKEKNTSASVFESGSMSASDAMSVLENASEEEKPVVQKHFNDLYGQVSTLELVGKLNTANDDKGDDFTIKFNGVERPVEKGYDASDSRAKKLTESYKAQTGKTSVPLGAVMIYDGKIYMYLENNDKNKDTWCIVQRRRGGKGSNSSSSGHFANLCRDLGIDSYSRDYEDSDT